MNSNISRASLAVLLGCLPVAAQKYSRFDEHPEERLALVARLAKQSAEDKQEARGWAKVHGKPMRFEQNGVLYELMAIDNDKPLYYHTLNVNAAISTAANLVRNTAPYNVDGSSVKVGVWDGGSVMTNHQEFGSRVVDLDGVSSSGHATHVGGTIGASGVDSQAKGMAPAALIDSYDWNAAASEMADAAASGPGQAGHLYLSNHSYAYTVDEEYLFGQYSSYVATVDELTYDSQYYLPFWAAGNEQGETASGYDTISSKGVAKNVITVGAVNDAVSGSLRSTGAATMIYFSSWGPVDDGRIKPDIVANGYNLYSCGDANDSDYAWMSGTSMATPNACGSAALLVDYYDDLFPGDAMRASTLKGLIIHTADDRGRPGPDYSYGWGLMNTLAAAELLKDYYANNPSRLTEATVTASQRSDSYTFFSDGNEPVRVTLCWTDPHGDAQSTDNDRTPRLVNDLDLKVVGPGGTPFWPYKLDCNNPANNATADSKNDIDNVEQVYVAAPAAGKYTATVDYDGSLSGSLQWYSLLISGPGVDSDADGMPDYWETTYFQSPTDTVASVDSDGDGADNLTEYISGYDPIDSNSVFKITAFSAPPAGSSPFIITWNPQEGRIYNVSWTPNLIYTSFTDISGDFPHLINSYTDMVERTDQQNFYHVDVRLDQ